jgi:hypothetical protein
MDAGRVFDPHQPWRDREEREMLRNRGQLLSRNRAERAVDLRATCSHLASELENVRLDLERLTEIAERLAEIGG